MQPAAQSTGTHPANHRAQVPATACPRKRIFNHQASLQGVTHKICLATLCLGMMGQVWSLDTSWRARRRGAVERGRQWQVQSGWPFNRPDARLSLRCNMVCAGLPLGDQESEGLVQGHKYEACRHVGTPEAQRERQPQSLGVVVGEVGALQEDGADPVLPLCRQNGLVDTTLSGLGVGHGGTVAQAGWGLWGRRRPWWGCRWPRWAGRARRGSRS